MVVVDGVGVCTSGLMVRFYPQPFAMACLSVLARPQGERDAGWGAGRGKALCLHLGRVVNGSSRGVVRWRIWGPDS